MVEARLYYILDCTGRAYSNMEFIFERLAEDLSDCKEVCEYGLTESGTIVVSISKVDDLELIPKVQKAITSTKRVAEFFNLNYDYKARKVN